MAILQIGPAFWRTHSKYGRLLLLMCLLVLANLELTRAQVRAIRITFDTNVSNQPLSGWNSQAFQSFSGIGPGCLQSPSGPSELQFVGWASSSGPQSFAVDHVAGTSGGVRPDYTRFDSIAPGVYQLEMNFNTFFGDPFNLPKIPNSCFTGTPSLLSLQDTIYNLSFRFRGDSVNTSFLNNRCGAIPDCGCSPACIGGIPTSAFQGPAVGGYYHLQDLHTANPVLLDSMGNRINPAEVLVEVIQAYDLKLTALGAPDSQYFARPLLHAKPIVLQVQAENYGFESIQGIEVKARVYDAADHLIFSSTSTLNKLDPFQTGYVGKTAREKQLLTFSPAFVPPATGKYRIEYSGSSVSADADLLNNRVIQFIEFTDSTFSRDNQEADGSYSLPGNLPFPTIGAIGQRFSLDKADSLTSISVAMDFRNHLPALGYPTINAALYTWDGLAQKPGTLVDTSFSYQLTTDDVGKLLTQTFSLSKGPQALFAGDYVIVIHQFGASYPIPFIYAQQIYEPGSLWQATGSYPPLPGSWQEVSSFQGAFHLRPNFGNAYCPSRATDSLGAAIQQVLLAGESLTLNHISGGNGGVYTRFWEQTADIIPEHSYPLQIILSDSGAGPYVDRRVAAFVDWNDDGDFTDAGESVGETGPISGGLPAPINTINIQVPANASMGTRKLRLVCVEGAAPGSITPCGTYFRGETEDYVLQVIPYLPTDQDYCEASAILYDDLIITRVTLVGEQSSINLAINNPEVGSRYSNFSSQQVTLRRNNNYNVAVSINDAQGNYQSLDKNRGFKVFIDWDQNGDFDPVTELAASALRFNFNGPGPVNMTISVPPRAVSGKTRMRIIAQRTSTLADINPCGFFDKGEVEDYTIFVPSDQPSFSSLPPLANPAYYIESVSLPGENISIQKNSSCSATSPAPVYQDFRSNLADLIPGKTYNMSVVFDACSFPSSLDSGKVFVYADWNKDGDIEDYDETLYASPFAEGISPAFDLKGKSLPVSIQVPVDVDPGFLSLYVEVASVGSTTKITNEVEEYTLIIRSPKDAGIRQVGINSEKCGRSQTIISLDICNFGQEEVYQIPVEVSVADRLYSLQYTDTLGPNACGSLIIDTVDTRGGEIWHIFAKINLSGDTDISNDTKSLAVTFGEVPRLDEDTLQLCQLDTAFLPNPSDQAIYYWYDTLSGGTPIDTGAFFVPTSVNQLETYYVQGEAFSHDSLDSWYPDSTGYFPETGQMGNIVDITAKTALSLDAFDLNLYIPAGDDTTVSIYFKNGSYHGFERDPLSWQLLGSFSVTSSGQGNKTRLNLSEAFPIATGQTVGFYIVGPLTNAIFLPFASKDFLTEENADLVTESGLTNCSPSPLVNGCLFGIRYWSSVIHYTKGCASERIPITLTFDQLPPTAVCQTITVSLDSNNMASLAASDVDGGSFDNCFIDSLFLDQTTFSCAEVGTNSLLLTVTDARNNSSSCQATVFVQDTIKPLAQCQPVSLSLDANGDAFLSAALVDAGSSDNCSVQGLDVSPNNFSCVNIGTSTVTLTVEDMDANTASCQALLTLTDDLPPTAVCQDISLALDATGNASLAASQIDGGTIDNCSAVTLTLSQSAFSCNEVGVNLVSLQTSDVFGNSSICQAQLRVIDTTAPTALCQAVSLYLDASGNAPISVAQVDNGSSDNCSLDTLFLNQPAVNCSQLGIQSLALIVQDPSDNTDSCQVPVTLIDTFPPVMSCQDASISLDANGEALLSPAQIDNGSVDFCGIQFFSLSENAFNCADVGITSVTLTGEDANGNEASCQANVTIFDGLGPTAICQDVTLSLDMNGSASLASSQIDNGSSDNCKLDGLFISQGTFSCTDIGVKSISLVVADSSGNINSCQAQVLVRENSPPVAICQPATVYLDATGNTTLSPSLVAGSSSDNCSIDSIQLSQNSFDCSSLGTLALSCTVLDGSGNSDLCQTSVTVLDTISPAMICQAVTLELNANGMASLAPSQVDNGSLDACGISSFSLEKSSFNCGNLGVDTLSLSGEDPSGNKASCQAVIRIEDKLAPSAVCQAVSLALDASGNASLAASQVDAGSTDNCGIQSISLSQNTFSCAQAGANLISLSVSDLQGNTSSCQAQVFVFETIPPTALCQAVTVFLDQTGNANITASQVDAGSNDNCALDTLLINRQSFGCQDIGTNIITLSVSDLSTNSASCQASVSIVDSIAPATNCQAVSLSLDANGSATLAINQVNTGSADACGIQSLTLSKNSFSCTDIGNNLVALTATDSSGNVAICRSIITVEDQALPVMACQNTTLALSSSGTASLSSSQVDAGSSDNCGFNSLLLSQTNFTCSDIGTVFVTLTGTDGSNNISTCQSQVTVTDNLPPLAFCQGVTLFLDATGDAMLTSGQVDAGSIDNCGIDTTFINQQTFDCSALGAQNITLTVTDLYANSSSCQAQVFIRDTISPVMNCQPVTLSLDANGTASLNPAQIDMGSFDACGISSYSLSKTTFTCADRGSQTVSLTGEDASGNTATCQITVSIQDILPPSAICQNLTLALNANGIAQLTSGQLDGGSNDNCGISSFVLSQDSFSCVNLGLNPVALSVTDASGNSQSCQAQVVVVDLTAPHANCQAVSLQLSPLGTAVLTTAQVNGGSQDNCAIQSLSLSQNQFDCSDLGVNSISLIVTDASNNSAACQASVTVQDIFPPVMNCQNVTLSLGVNGTAQLLAQQLVGGSVDNCGIDSFDVSTTFFDCGDIGTQTVTLRAFDVSGNLNSCQSQVTVQDVMAPQMSCQASVTLVLNTSGVANLSLTQVNSGTTDNCMLDSLSLSQNTFDSLDTYSVYLRGVDIYGNQDSCLTVVSVQDTAAPVMICQSVILDLDAQGMATLAISDVDNGSSDRSGTLSLSIDKTNFDCTDVGVNQVTLTGFSTNQLTAFCLANVTVRDTIKPSIGCQSVNLILDNQGHVSLLPAQVSTGSSDNCGPVVLALSQTFFDCTDLNTNSVTLSASDVNGNIASCTANISVSDLSPPVVSCQAVTLHLDILGTANLTVNQVDNGSSDNCGIAFRGLNKSTFSCSDVGNNTVRLAVIDNSGINVNCQTSVFVEDSLPPVVICKPATLYLDQTGNVSLAPSQVDGGSVDNCGISSLSLDRTQFNCLNVGSQTVTLSGSDNSNQSSSCTAQISIQDSTGPNMICQPVDLYLDANGSASLTVSQVDGGSSDACGIVFRSIDKSSFDCSLIGSHTVTLSATDINTNQASCQAPVTIHDTLPPVMVCQDITISLDNTSTVSLSSADIDAGSSDNCGITSLSLSQSSFTFLQNGSNTISLTGSDGQSNTANCSAIVTVQDTSPPNMICQTVTLALDAGGIANLSPAQVDNGSNDIYGITSFVLSEDLFNCSHIGQNTVTLTGTNANGYSASCQATIWVEDNLPPAMSCQAAQVNLDAQGTATLTAAAVDGGSLDNCGITAFSINRTQFSCSDINQNITVTLTATDAEGNSASCQANVTVRDQLAPVMNCRTAILPLDANGNANLSTAQINNGSSDNCGISLLALSKSNFTCANKGINSVTLIAIDNYGNSATCQTFVFVQDLSTPVMACQNVSLYLDANGQASLLPAQIDAGSQDNCGITSLTISQSSFDCSHVGQQTLTFSGVDASMNDADCQANVTILDTLPPTAVCSPTTLFLDSNGQASLTSAQFDAGSNDICGLAGTSLSQDSFSCSNIGPNLIDLTVTDINGNSAVCQALVTIADSILPSMQCLPLSLYLDSTGNATLAPSQVDGGSNDNCGIISLTLSQTQFGVMDIGTLNVTLTGEDGQGNQGSCNSLITVLDTFPPSMKCRDVDIYLDINGSASLTVNQVDAGSTDPAGIISFSLDKSQFSCLDKGPNTVILTATNSINLNASCQATVMVFDTLLPTVSCQHISLSLDQNGTTSLAVSDINTGSQDNCGIQSLVLSQTQFGCADTGNQSVVLTATDESGNIASCTSTLFIQDTQAPDINCLSPTLFLDSKGSVKLSLNQIDGGSSDNCGIVSWEVSRDSFSCSDIGQLAVSLKAEDASGNQATCLSTITIQDSLPPAMNCKTATLILDASGMASLALNEVDAGITDNCGLDSVYVSKDQFGVADVGQNPVTVTATDIFGNIDSCLTIVNVQDSTAPTMVCKPVSLALDASGNASLAVSEIDGGSSDIAGFVSLTISKSSFSCLDIGQTLVSLTGTNTRGISASCQAQVNVVDLIPPDMHCQAINLTLNANGIASISPSQIDAGSSDNCSLNQLELDQDTFTCSDVGNLMISLSGRDESGNTASCQANVLVEDVSPPLMSCQTVILPLDSNGVVNLSISQIDGGSIDNCGIQFYTLSQSQFGCNDVGQNLITLTGEDGSNKIASCQAIVIVQDNIPPTMRCKDTNLTLDANGNSSLTISQVNDASFDNCGISSLSLSKLSFNCTDVGTNTVSLTGIDTQGNIDSCRATITVIDSDLPQLSCQAVNVYLNANGQASLTPGQVDAGSQDNCSIASLAISQQNFDCSHVGQRTVVLTATDANLNSASCQANIAVLDTLAPAISCRSLTLVLDSVGNASLAASQINAGSSDNCAIDTFTLSQSSFTLADLGQNTISLTATDVNGNSNSCVATVTIQDLSLPTMLCQNAIVYLDSNGETSLAASHIDAGSSDSQGLTSLIARPSNFNCGDLGQSIVTLTGTNVAGNRASCFAILSIQDTILPVVNCRSAILSLNANGLANLPVAFINAGSGDNCQLTSFGLSKSIFGCNDIGTNVVTLTGTDDAGNAASCTTTVQVIDPVAPNALCKAATIYLNSSGMATLNSPQINAGSNDNCSISILALSKSTFGCSDEGPNTVTLVSIDGSGNSSTCQATVTVRDTIPPVVSCQPVTLTLDANSRAVLNSAQVTASANDNCAIDSLHVGQRIFTPADVGQNLISLIATDIYGNRDSCLTNVTVRDTTGPSMQCQSVVLSLNAQGTASISPAMVDAGSSDRYGQVSLSISPNAFSCADKGPNTVTMTGVNVNGVPASCQTTVTVRDIIPPTMICQAGTLALSPTGTATLSPGLVDAGSFDNCGIASRVLSKVVFNCADIGTRTITYAGTDSSSNFSSCQTTVTVVDNQVPVAVCQNLSLPLDANGNATLTPTQLDGGSSDNCDMIMALSQSSFDCSDIGSQSVVLAITDAGNNTASCLGTVQVQDTMPPTLSCRSVVLQLGQQGYSILTVNQVATSNSDNCGIPSLVLSKDSFSCSDIGMQVVTLTATDGSNNQTSCQANVRITDSRTPDMKCQATTVYLDPNGRGSLTAAQVDAGSSDNCGIATLFVGQTSFDCDDMGLQSIPLAAVDRSGNSGGCIAAVTVADTIPPMAVCEPAVLTLNVNGHATLSLSQINAGSSDNCGLQSLSLNKTTFTCADAGIQMVTLTAIDSSGNQHSCTTTVQVLDTTAAPDLLVLGDTMFCEGNQVILKTTPGFLAYEWSNGQKDSTISVTRSDTLRVRVSYAPGCWTPFSVSQIVVVDPAIPMPSIIQIGLDSLQCSISDGNAYTWFRDDSLLMDSTRTIFAAQNGEYKVIVIRGLCTSDTSSIYLINTSLDDPASGPKLELYPNPNRGLFFLRGDFGTSSLVDIAILQMDGKLVMEKQAFAPGGKLDELLSLKAVADGVYLLRVRVNNRFYWRKVEVMR